MIKNPNCNNTDYVLDMGDKWWASLCISIRHKRDNGKDITEQEKNIVRLCDDSKLVTDEDILKLWKVNEVWVLDYSEDNPTSFLPFNLDFYNNEKYAVFTCTDSHLSDAKVVEEVRKLQKNDQEICFCCLIDDTMFSHTDHTDDTRIENVTDIMRAAWGDN